MPTNDIYLDTGFTPNITDPKLYTSSAQGSHSFTATITETAVAVSDSVGRVAVLTRSPSESTPAAIDTVQRGAASFARMPTETLPTPGDVVVRMLVALRTISETIPALLDSPNGAQGRNVDYVLGRLLLSWRFG